MKAKTNGQALVSLLVFMLIAISITTGAVLLLISNSTNTTKISQGGNALAIAEAGAENALIKMLRSPAYTGETVSLSGGEGVVVVTGNNPYLIRSRGTSGNFVRVIEVSVQFTDNKMSIVSWKEVF